MIHINLNMIFYTHVEHSSTQTTRTKHHMERRPPPPNTHTWIKTTMNSAYVYSTPPPQPAPFIPVPCTHTHRLTPHQEYHRLKTKSSSMPGKNSQATLHLPISYCNSPPPPPPHSQPPSLFLPPHIHTHTSSSSSWGVWMNEWTNEWKVYWTRRSAHVKQGGGGWGDIFCA